MQQEQPKSRNEMKWNKTNKRETFATLCESVKCMEHTYIHAYSHICMDMYVCVKLWVQCPAYNSHTHTHSQTKQNRHGSGSGRETEAKAASSALSPLYAVRLSCCLSQNPKIQPPKIHTHTHTHAGKARTQKKAPKILQTTKSFHEN